MNQKSLTTLVIVVQIISMGVTGIILTMDLSLNMTGQDLESIGGTITTIFMVLGVVIHIQSMRGTPRPELMALLGIFAPVYAYIAGPVRHTFGFMVIGLGFHLFVLWNMRKRQRLAEANEEGGGEDA